jgi:crotonobetainyl-CoA:carnitine CoA-transferase CaiB-like acyl-CoA transferase
MDQPFLPLRGITVLAWEQAVSLPAGTRLLADLGARVIRLDAPSRGRARPRHLGNDLGRNKESIALNLRDPRGQEVFKALIRRVDVVCENFTPRVKRQYGLTYEDLIELRPDLIMLSLCGYGQTGRMSNRPTFGPGIEASSGHARMTGFPEQPPLRPGSDFFADSATGFYAAFAIGAALLRRRLTGKGQYIDLAMYEVCAYHLTASLARASLTGQDPPRRGNDDEAALVQGVFPTDVPGRWLAVTLYPERVEAAAALLGCAPEPVALRDALTGWARERSAEAGADQLQGAGVAAAPVLDVRDLTLNPQLRHRGAFGLLRHSRPVNGYAAHPHMLSPFLVPGRPRSALIEAPLSGQDSRDLLRELLDISDAAIDALVADGIIAEPPLAAAPAPEADMESIRSRLEWKVLADFDPDPGRTLGLPTASAEPEPAMSEVVS